MKIKTAQLAEVLGMTRQGIWKMVKAGRLPQPVRQLGREGSYWDFNKKLVYILKDLGITNVAETLRQTDEKGTKR